MDNCPWCGKIAADGKVLCEDCVKKQKDKYYARKLTGLCVNCGSRPNEPGKTKCFHCINQRKNRYTSRKESGICPRCGEVLIGGKKRCQQCLEKARRQSHAIVSRYRYSKNQAKKRGIEFLLSLEEYQGIIACPCHYCGMDNNVIGGCGLDRIHSDSHYVKNNCCSCCDECNVAKNRWFTEQEMLDHIGPAIRAIKQERLAKGTVVTRRILKS